MRTAHKSRSLRVVLRLVQSRSATLAPLAGRGGRALLPAMMMMEKTTRSMFGDQVYSKRRSAPMFGFGSSTRNQAAKVFLSAEHAKLSTPGFSPGPSAYTLRASVGYQADGRKASSPQWVFGSSDRFMASGSKGIQNPGAHHAEDGTSA